MRPLARVIALCLAGALVSPAVFAEETPEDPSAELYRQGASFASEGRWQEALAKFEAAVALRATAVGLFNLAQAERNVGHLVAAKGHFAQARDTARQEGSADVERLAAEALAEVEPRIAHVTLVLPPDAAGIRVELDGRPVESARSELELDPGKHRLRVVASAEKPFVRELSLSEGQRVRVPVEFPSARPEPAPKAPTPAPQPPSRTPSAEPPLGPILLGGVGFAALTAGTIFHLQRNDQLYQAAEGCTRSDDGWRCPASLKDDPERDALRDRAERSEVLRNVFLSVGTAAVIGSGVWWALGARSERQPPQVALSIEPGPRQAAARLRFGF